MSKTETATTTRLLTDDELTQVSGGHNPPGYIVAHNPPGYLVGGVNGLAVPPDPY